METKLVISEASQVAQARRQALALAQSCEFSEENAGKVALVVTECATNLLKYAGGGEMIIRTYAERGQSGIEILATDNGPGIRDVAESQADGYSTGGTLGLGMGSIHRLSTDYELYSLPDAGTVLWSRVDKSRTSSPVPIGPVHRLMVSGIATPKPGQDVCGDRWVSKQADGALWVAVIDGLGHGPQAAVASAQAARAFQAADPQASVQDVLRLTHEQIKGTRGAVMAVAAIRPALSSLEFSGVGNISAMLANGATSQRLASYDGTLGYSVRTIRQQTYTWTPDSVLIMASDGISTRWNLAAHPGLLSRHPSVIAAALHRDFGRQNDDTTLLAVKEYHS